MEEKKFYNKEGKEVKRQACQIRTRVMGYIRPIRNYNPGKKSEFYDRKTFSEQKATNSAFIRKRSNVV